MDYTTTSSPSDGTSTVSARHGTHSEQIAQILRTPVVIPGNKEEELVELARAHSPDEACGYGLLDDGELLYLRTLPNLATDPNREFLLDPCTVSNVLHWCRFDRVVLWHTHPKAWVFPSRTDCDLLKSTLLRQIIVGLKGQPEVAVYGLKGERVIRLRAQ